MCVYIYIYIERERDIDIYSVLLSGPAMSSGWERRKSYHSNVYAHIIISYIFIISDIIIIITTISHIIITITITVICAIIIYHKSYYSNA